MKVADVGASGSSKPGGRHAGQNSLLPEGEPVPSGGGICAFDPQHTHIYRDGWLVS